MKRKSSDAEHYSIYYSHMKQTNEHHYNRNLTTPTDVSLKITHQELKRLIMRNTEINVIKLL